MASYGFGYTNTAQIVNNTIINTTKITKGYAFDDILINPVSFSKPFAFGYIKGFENKLVDISGYIKNLGEIKFENEDDDSYLDKKINLNYSYPARVICRYDDNPDDNLISFAPPPDDFILYINGIEQPITNLPDDSGLAVMSSFYGFTTTWKYGDNITFTCNDKYSIDVESITINDKFLDTYWSFKYNRFTYDKIYFAFRITKK
jgi:hypothetical protein